MEKVVKLVTGASPTQGKGLWELRKEHRPPTLPKVPPLPPDPTTPARKASVETPGSKPTLPLPSHAASSNGAVAGFPSPQSLATPLLAAASPVSPATSGENSPLSHASRSVRRTAASTSILDEGLISEMSEGLTKKEKFVLSTFWTLLVLTAALSGTLSFAIDQFTFVVGTMRSSLLSTGFIGALVTMSFNVAVAVVARLLVRTTVEAEGSGFPEMKAMLFGKVLFNYLTMRVLVVKATALALVVGAGLPIGKEGPNVHMAACIARSLSPGYFESRKDQHHGAAGAGGSGHASAVTRLLLAACAVGVGASFSSAIGGVIFALELMLPQTYDATTYWGCFTAGVIGSVVYAAERSWTAGATGLLPLMSTNLLPEEGAVSTYPLLRIWLDVVLGAICGVAGGLWVRNHAYVAGVLKRWRLAETWNEPTGFVESFRDWFMFLLGGKWRDLGQVAAVVAINTAISAWLPLLAGRPQPVLISLLFDKTLLENGDKWVLPLFGPLLTMFICFLFKWSLTVLALALPIPTGVVAPAMIIGGLLGRCYGLLMPDWFIDMIVTVDGESVVGGRGALMARFAIVGAAAFCSATTRAFAMAITVFEVLSLPNQVLPLCSSCLVAIFFANKVSLPFFDQNLAGRGFAGIPALTFSDKANEPAMRVMQRLDDINCHCLKHQTNLRTIMAVLANSKDEFFPIVRVTDPEKCDIAYLEGEITRQKLGSLLKKLDPSGSNPDLKVDLLDYKWQNPPDGSDPFVDGLPNKVTPTMTMKDVYLLMKVAGGESHVYVTDRGVLQGTITFGALISREV